MSFIIRRLVFYVVAAWVALTINFFIPRLVPGNASWQASPAHRLICAARPPAARSCPAAGTPDQSAGTWTCGCCRSPRPSIRTT